MFDMDQHLWGKKPLLRLCSGEAMENGLKVKLQASMDKHVMGNKGESTFERM